VLGEMGLTVAVRSEDAEAGLLAALDRDDPRGIDEIQAQTGRPIQAVLAELATLEMEDKVRRLPGALYVRN
jgi:predicted Rossmann fold nucleotide-binding protein DprA/Smf involved in DNA uptake